MQIEEILTISVEDDQWLEVVNHNISPLKFIDNHAILDYVALKADDAIPDGMDQVDDILFSFDPKEALGMTAKELITDYVSAQLLLNYFERTNNAYCEMNKLCTRCRGALIKTTDEDKLECENGC